MISSRSQRRELWRALLLGLPQSKHWALHCPGTVTHSLERMDTHSLYSLCCQFGCLVGAGGLYRGSECPGWFPCALTHCWWVWHGLFCALGLLHFGVPIPPCRESINNTISFSEKPDLVVQKCMFKKAASPIRLFYHCVILWWRLITARTVVHACVALVAAMSQHSKASLHPVIHSTGACSQIQERVIHRAGPVGQEHICNRSFWKWPFALVISNKCILPVGTRSLSSFCCSSC